MIFEKDKYYKYIQQLENFQNITSFIIIGLFVIMGIATKNIMGFILCTGLGIFISWAYLIRIRIKIQEMKWKIDYYHKIIDKI